MILVKHVLVFTLESEKTTGGEGCLAGIQRDCTGCVDSRERNLCEWDYISPWFLELGACLATVILSAGFKKLLLHCDSHIVPLEDKQLSNCALPPML